VGEIMVHLSVGLPTVLRFFMGFLSLYVRMTR
jgi:hypothetical protein